MKYGFSSEFDPTSRVEVDERTPSLTPVSDAAARGSLVPTPGFDQATRPKLLMRSSSQSPVDRYVVGSDRTAGATQEVVGARRLPPGCGRSAAIARVTRSVASETLTSDPNVSGAPNRTTTCRRMR